MQAGSPPEDLHAILSRFHTWAEKAPGNGHGKGRDKGAPIEGIREIPYEEAIQQHRERQAARAPRRTAAKPGATAVPQLEPSPESAPDLPQVAEDLPLWAANLPVVPEDEPVIELRAAPEGHGREVAATVASTAAVSTPRFRAQRAVRQPAPGETQSRPLETILAAALPARAFVDLPPAPLAPRHRPQSKRAPAAAQPKAIAQTEPPPPAPPAPPVRSAAAPHAARAAKTPAAPEPSAPQPRPRPARAATAPGLIGSPIRPTAKLPAPHAAVRRTASTDRPQPRPAKHPPFRQILASTVQQPKAVPVPKKAEPDRTRRITTRFSPAEERRIEKCAAELGITVSAYLRQCALSALTRKPQKEEGTAPTLPAKVRRPPARRATAQPMQYAAPAPSVFGGWLALLRNRFLGPPVRFSEDA